MDGARIDKWLWAARVFKTRTISTEACRKGHIQVNGVQVKASHMIRPGDRISVRKPPVTYTLEVIRAIEKRVGAKMLSDVVKDLTPVSELEILEMSRVSGFIGRAKGTGRPTKKDRRDLEEGVLVPFFTSDFDDLEDAEDDPGQEEDEDIS